MRMSNPRDIIALSMVQIEENGTFNNIIEIPIEQMNDDIRGTKVEASTQDPDENSGSDGRR